MNTLNHDIGARISALRRKNSLTQMQLAEDLDISTKHLSEVERGLARLSMEKLLVLCNIFSVDLDYLVRGIDRAGKQQTEIPSFVIDIFASDDKQKKELLKEYLYMYKKIETSK